MNDREPDAATIESMAEMAHELYFDHEWSEAAEVERALWRNVARALWGVVTALVPAVPVVERERIVEAAREYAESRRTWEAALELATDGEIDAATWTDLCARQDAARAALLALFHGETDVAARAATAQDDGGGGVGDG